MNELSRDSPELESHYITPRKQRAVHGAEAMAFAGDCILAGLCLTDDSSGILEGGCKGPLVGVCIDIVPLDVILSDASIWEMKDPIGLFPWAYDTVTRASEMKVDSDWRSPRLPMTPQERLATRLRRNKQVGKKHHEMLNAPVERVPS